MKRICFFHAPPSPYACVCLFYIDTGYRSCVMVAHDWGASVAYMFATKHKTMVDKLVICNGVHPAALNKLMATDPDQRKKSWYVINICYSL